jgi:hypothetical protein
MSLKRKNSLADEDDLSVADGTNKSAAAIRIPTDNSVDFAKGSSRRVQEKREGIAGTLGAFRPAIAH